MAAAVSNSGGFGQIAASGSHRTGSPGGKNSDLTDVHLGVFHLSSSAFDASIAIDAGIKTVQPLQAIRRS